MLKTDTRVVKRLRLSVRGTVQGVGFRPFVYRLAQEMGLCGVVLNSPLGVRIEVEGASELLRQFIERLETEKPRASILSEIECRTLSPHGYNNFTIIPSDARGAISALVTPDVGTCTLCVNEIFDPANRRFRYPFTNCTQCGPRYTVVERVPFDRVNTSMRQFVMCPECLKEYFDPADRRLHAQTNACPECGPRVEIVSLQGVQVVDHPIEKAVAILRNGGIISLKGIGGFQLLADAFSPDAVARLRLAKKRDEKPFAVMFRSINEVDQYCHVTPEERRLLCSDAAPIVLLRPRLEKKLAPAVSLSSPHLGAMLPYSPLHHLLLQSVNSPVVATSCNRSGEPITYENSATFARFKDSVDAFLWHDRPILQSCDDSVVKMIGGNETVIRGARGYAPVSFVMRRHLPKILAVGGHFKNTIAIASGRQLLLSEHIADLDTVEACDTFRRKVDNFCKLHGFRPDAVACDLHPLYYSTSYANSLGFPLIPIQHHHAHLAACMLDNDVSEPCLGVAWDGSGFGLDQTIWGGEFFLWDRRAFTRFAHLRPFKLLGGDRAARDGRRCAYSILREIFGNEPPIDVGLSEVERETFDNMLKRDINAPLTTSAGRLFDAVAAITGIAARSRFEGQAAIRLEGTIAGARGDDHYPASFTNTDCLELDWRPMFAELVQDIKYCKPLSEIALKFHNTLSRWIVQVAVRTHLSRIVLSGGVFQNGYLVQRVCDDLKRHGISVYKHRRIPPNDGGLSAGQAVLAAQYLEAGKSTTRYSAGDTKSRRKKVNHNDKL